MKIYALLASLLLVVSPQAWATVWQSDGSPTSIQTIHGTQAVNGDTITLPAGTFTWTSGVTISKAITIQGAGASNTIINDNCQNVQLFGVTLVPNQLTRITGVTLQNAGRTGNSPALQVDGSNTDGSKFRFDHNTYTNIAGLFILNTVIGVIDHNTWTQPGHAGFFIYGGHWNGGGVGKGDESWVDSTNFGGSQFLFVEDNNFIGTASSEVLPLTDAYYGARFVIRHNTIRNMYVANHGTESSGRIRGGRALEVYNNTYLGTGINRYIVGIRSGCMLVHDNTVTGYFGGSATIAFVNYRNLAPFLPWDLGLSGVDGTSQWDNNDSTVYFTGTAASSGTDTVTVNGSPQWATNQWADYVVRRTTNLGSSGSVTYGWIISNTSNTLSYRGTAGFHGFTDMTFANGDGVEIRRVNAALDQPGRARGSLITSDPTPTLPWPAGQNDQVTEPMYFWNNIVTETGQNISVIENGTGGSRQGIHWFNGQAMPGYTPYTYPHPLAVGGSPTPTPTASPTPTPSATVTPTVTPSATVTPTATPTASPTAAPCSLLNGLQVYYSLSDLNDSSGNALTLTNHNGVTFVSGKIGNAANFLNTSSQWLSHADAVQFQPGTGPWSVAVWINTTTTGSSNSIIDYGKPQNGLFPGYQIRMAASNVMAVMSDGTHLAFKANSAIVNDGAWHLIIATFDRTGNISTYVDNGAVQFTSLTSVTGSVNDTTGWGLTIGRDINGSFFTGQIGPVAMWNRLLTANDMSGLWNGGSGVAYPLCSATPTPTATFTPTPTPTPLFTPTATPSSTPSATATFTPTPTATATATATFTPTPTSTPTSTPTPSATATSTPTATPITVPSAPTGLRLAAALILQWNPNPAGEGVTSYKLYRVKHGGADLVDTVVTTSDDVTSFLNAKQTKFYITAVNMNGEGGRSGTITVRR